MVTVIINNEFIIINIKRQGDLFGSICLLRIDPKTHLVAIFTVKGLIKEQHGSYFTMHYKPVGCSYKVRVACMCA